MSNNLKIKIHESKNVCSMQKKKESLVKRKQLMEYDIPKNDNAELLAKKTAEHQAELDAIAKQFLDGLKKSDTAEVKCTEHMIGYQGSTDYHHLSDTIEVAKEFKKQGYYCYYYNGYNNHGVNQRGVCVCKVPKTDSEINQFRNKCVAI